VCFFTLNDTYHDSGFGGTLYVNGEFTYLCVVVLANLKLGTSTCSHDGGVITLGTASVGCFLLLSWAINLVPSSTIYAIFIDMFMFSMFLPDLVILTISIVAIDIGLKHVHMSITYIKRMREAAAERRR